MSIFRNPVGKKPGFDCAETRLAKNRVSTVQKPGWQKTGFREWGQKPGWGKTGFRLWGKNRVSTLGKKPGFEWEKKPGFLIGIWGDRSFRPSRNRVFSKNPVS